MIRESSLGLAELIAVANPNFRPSEIIQGLNGVSTGLEPYGEQFRKEIVEVTAGDETEHTEVLTVASNRLAEIVRGALENISAYGKPLAVAIAKAADVCYSKESLKRIAESNFKHRFIWLNDPFFDSAVYPKEVKDKSFAYTNVGLSALERLQFDYPSNDQVMEFVNSSHADVVEIMRDRDCSAGSAASLLGDLEYMGDYFVRNSNGNYDFSRIKNLDSERLLKAYVILTKMYTEENPVPWLKAGTLQDYREYVITLWNALTSHLINLKAVVAKYRESGLVIVDNGPVRLVDGKGSEQEGVRLVEADTLVFYTDAVLASITEGGNSLGEVLLGYYWERLTKGSRPVGDILANPAHFQAKVTEYYNHVNEKLANHSRERFLASGLKAIQDFVVSNENITQRLTEVRGQTTDLLGTWIRENFIKELDNCFRNVMGSTYSFDEPVAEGEEHVTMESLVMGSRIVPIFLRKLHCELAADILEDTYVTQATEDNVKDQRERLTVAIINVIVDKCLL